MFLDISIYTFIYIISFSQKFVVNVNAISKPGILTKKIWNVMGFMDQYVTTQLGNAWLCACHMPRRQTSVPSHIPCQFETNPSEAKDRIDSVRWWPRRELVAWCHVRLNEFWGNPNLTHVRNENLKIDVRGNDFFLFDDPNHPLFNGPKWVSFLFWAKGFLWKISPHLRWWPWLTSCYCD
jgi:hypothetical protein